MDGSQKKKDANIEIVTANRTRLTIVKSIIPGLKADWKRFSRRQETEEGMKLSRHLETERDSLLIVRQSRAVELVSRDLIPSNLAGVR